MLRFLAAVLQARAVVELHTGSGENALSLLDGMLPDGVLTSIDVDPDAQRSARAALSAAGVPAARARLITGKPTEVLSRLTEGGYDLVLVDADRIGYPKYLQLGVRLLRPGGVIVFVGVRAGGTATARDAHALALRDLTRAIEADETLVPAVIPAGAGMLAVARP